MKQEFKLGKASSIISDGGISYTKTQILSGKGYRKGTLRISELCVACLKITSG